MLIWVLDQAQNDAAVAITTPHWLVEPRVINKPTASIPGLGSVYGLYMLNADLLDNPYYEPWSELLSPLPTYDVDPNDLFIQEEV